MSISLNRRQFLSGIVFTSTAFMAGCSRDQGATSSQESTPQSDNEATQPVTEPSAEPATREYIADSEIDAMFTDPDAYVGKWVVLPGKTLRSSERSGDITALQAYYDITKYDRSYIVQSDTTESFSDGEYIFVNGMIGGTFSGENMFGAKLEVPLIVDARITKSTYVDVVAPAIASSEPAVSVVQNDVTFTCDRVEYAQIETRVYLTVSNGSPNEVSYGLYSIRIVANGQQIDQDSSSSSAYNGDYQKLSYDVSAGASTSGVLVFPPMDAHIPFEIVIPDVYSDNYEIRFDEMRLAIPAV